MRLAIWCMIFLVLQWGMTIPFLYVIPTIQSQWGGVLGMYGKAVYVVVVVSLLGAMAYRCADVIEKKILTNKD